MAESEMLMTLFRPALREIKQYSSTNAGLDVSILKDSKL
jgi:hypothetical protein